MKTWSSVRIDEYEKLRPNGIGACALDWKANSAEERELVRTRWKN